MSTFKTAKIFKSKESPRNCHNQEELKKTSQVLWHPEWDAGREKRH